MHGPADDIGYFAVEDRMHIHDFHATVPGITVLKSQDRAGLDSPLKYHPPRAGKRARSKRNVLIQVAKKTVRRDTLTGNDGTAEQFFSNPL